MFHIDVPRAADAAAIDALLDVSFGPGREAKTSYRYRDGIPQIADLAAVARDGERIVGTIAYWPLFIGGPDLPAILLGPVAAAPDRQSEGIGAALMRCTLDRAAAAGHRIVLLVGDLAYYCRFGFEAAGPHGFFMPGEKTARLQVKALVPGALADAGGTIRRGDGRLPAIGRMTADAQS